MQQGRNQHLGDLGLGFVVIGFGIFVAGFFFNNFYTSSSLANVPFGTFILSLIAVIFGSGFMLMGIAMLAVKQIRGG